MYETQISEKLEKVLGKLQKKDKNRFEATIKKIDEITVKSPDSYKNLRYELKGLKRVHIDSHFVLVFKVDEERKIISFEELQHHDDIYRR